MAKPPKPSAKVNMSPGKAKQILTDGTVRGNPLSQAQKGLFGAIAGGGGSAAAPKRKPPLAIGQRPGLGKRTKAAMAKPPKQMKLQAPPRI